MNFIISLAFKNLTRYKRRTLITAIAIAFGIMMYVFIDSMLLGAEYESVRNLKWYETSSARIFASGYWQERYQHGRITGIFIKRERIRVLSCSDPRPPRQFPVELLYAGIIVFHVRRQYETGGIAVRL